MPVNTRWNWRKEDKPANKDKKLNRYKYLCKIFTSQATTGNQRKKKPFSWNKSAYQTHGDEKRKGKGKSISLSCELVISSKSKENTG
jgi:hypothetical protein